MTINVTVTGKWTHGTGQDDTNDPAPPSVMVIETVYLDQDGVNGDGTLATGAFDDAFGDQSYVVSSYRGLDQVCTTPSGIPIQHQSIEPGSPFTIARTFKVSSTAAAYQQNGCNAAAHFEGYTATIHAQPYNFHKVNPPTIDNVGGNLRFYWGWLSTDGSIADLTSCTIYEYITWSGDGTTGTTVDGLSAWAPSSPPVGAAPQGGTFAYPSPVIMPDPTVQSNKGNAVGGRADDSFTAPTFINPCQGPSATWTGHQVYYFDDSFTGQTKVKIPAPIATDDEDDIVRSVTSMSGNTWMYTVKTRGVSASIAPLP